MQTDQGVETIRPDDPQNWEEDWWSIKSMPDQEIPQQEALRYGTELEFCSTNNWNQSKGELQRKTFLDDERQRDHLARIGCIYDYQTKNFGSESDQWTSESNFQSLLLPDALSQASSHGEMTQCGLNNLDHSDTALDGVGPGFSEETFSICNSKFGTHTTDEFGQDTWEKSSGREYSWSSPLTMPYSMFGEAPSQRCGSNSQSSSHGRWDQKRVDESDGQSIKIEPLSGPNGLDLSSFCGNWVDESLALSQNYRDPTENSAISPESLKSFQNPLGELPVGLTSPTSVNIGEVTAGIVDKILLPGSRHGSSVQAPSIQEATSDPCPRGHVRICPRPEEPPRNPSGTPHQDGQVTGASKPEVQLSRKRQPRGQTSSGSSVPRLIHPKLPSDERSWRSSSLDSRSAPTRRSSPRGRTNPNARAAQRKIMKDQFLIESKFAGMSYREIREKGNFSEAESTLRGRFRTLTKEKGKRVRKPEWEDEDIRLLQRAVEDLAASSDSTQAFSLQNNKNVKIPWKQVAEYIAKHGGSYHFGNATCRKKWDETRNCSLKDSLLKTNDG
ncbi:MAG: hypothetical protein M1840_001634 [Geoglossum simile]|nr:MAG: hypothetical protein M1840_001634 [Geoglossum simile]